MRYVHDGAARRIRGGRAAGQRQLVDLAVVLEPLTGRTNQLRIQLAKIGNPILGDDVYAFRRDFPVKFRRLALHAAFLGFMHPVSRQHIRLKAALPRDMEDFLSGKA